MKSLLLVDENVADENKGEEQSAGKGDEENVDPLRNHFLSYKRSPLTSLEPTCVQAAVIIVGTVIGDLGVATVQFECYKDEQYFQ